MGSRFVHGDFRHVDGHIIYELIPRGIHPISGIGLIMAILFYSQVISSDDRCVGIVF